ncbi:MAG: L,D-transpeptidase [Gammaproteobacteria bacterium]|nr:MAG: L,D-transpeptidase [Gammaproteobacteria bacterium]
MSRRILISIARQRLWLHEGDRLLLECPVSTAANGPGERMDSECTPRGRHRICEKIGAGAPVGTVFVGRRPTGEVWTPELRGRHPDRDWILTRILWLEGLEEGFNRGGEVDSRARYIYIHGTPDDVPLGVPGSRGCIRVASEPLLRLYDAVEVGDEVLIREE